MTLLGGAPPLLGVFPEPADQFYFFNSSCSLNLVPISISGIDCGIPPCLNPE